MNSICKTAAVFVILAAIALPGCQAPEERTIPQSKRINNQEFTELFIQKSNPNAPDQLSFREITPEPVYEETGVQLFKDSKTCDTYLLLRREYYPLGIGFGGFGVVDVAVSDFDENGEKELLYTYSFGSGIHRALIGLFDLARREEITLYNGAKEEGFVFRAGEDLMLEKCSEQEFEVYTAKITLDGADFASLTLEKDRLVGKVSQRSGKPTADISE